MQSRGVCPLPCRSSSWAGISGRFSCRVSRNHSSVIPEVPIGNPVLLNSMTLDSRLRGNDGLWDQFGFFDRFLLRETKPCIVNILVSEGLQVC